ncbi:lysophospholipase L1-like esterase [Neobacillus niacini]|uniref:SGNH/GDSL hydrolase family protein n=1 Tax=Neobacillus niacini TaxID=86668 RepID=UPI0027852C7F|nr:SGNH/GDSL hydrolase family protein [Neobacillus niacini]MDQ1000323.1 lysophospholipase L1-like esterase [Neobacillus niacini]
MKYFLTAVWAIICIGILAYGHIHWNQQTAVKAVVEPDLNQETSETDYADYLALAANWPEEAKQQFKLALEEEKPYKILFVGSAAMEWEKSVTQSLSENFGSDRVITAKHTYNLSSKDIVAENKQVELAAEQGQLVVIEPFLFNDNGKLKIDVTLSNLTKIIEDIKAANPNSTLILQPSYPIYLPKYYSTQVEALKEYATANNMTYLDHWAAWPATDNPEIKNFLNEDQSAPNEQGYQVWGQFLTDYFVNKKAN